jgi:hypothetical protein
LSPAIPTLPVSAILNQSILLLAFAHPALPNIEFLALENQMNPTDSKQPLPRQAPIAAAIGELSGEYPTEARQEGRQKPIGRCHLGNSFDYSGCNERRVTHFLSHNLRAWNEQKSAGKG